MLSDGTCLAQSRGTLQCTYSVLDDGRVKVDVQQNYGLPLPSPIGGEVLMGTFDSGKLALQMVSNPSYHVVLEREAAQK